MSNIKGYIYAAASSSTFGLAPFFTISLLASGFSSFEVLTYRWGIASLTLGIFGVLLRETFRISRKDWGTVFVLSLLRAATSLSLVIAVLISLAGAALLSSGEIDFKGGNTTTGLIAATLSVFFYGGYIVGVRKSRAIHIPSTALTCYVMGLGALFFIIGGSLTGGIQLATGGQTWLNILGLALPATAISNITLVKAIKYIGPTLTSIFGALEPLTAVAIGCLVFKESFTPGTGLGILLILTAVTVVIMHEKKTS